MPFSNEEIEQNIFIKEAEVETRLRNFFFKSATFIYRSAVVVEVFLEEYLFFGFKTFDKFIINLKLINTKLYLYSTFELKEFNNASQLIFNRIKYGLKYYKQTLLFDGIFSSIDLRFVYIAYDGDAQNLNPVVRRFPFYYSCTWGETITEQQNVFLKECPNFDFNGNKLARTEETEDKCRKLATKNTNFIKVT